MLVYDRGFGQSSAIFLNLHKTVWEGFLWPLDCFQKIFLKLSRKSLETWLTVYVLWGIHVIKTKVVVIVIEVNTGSTLEVGLGAIKH